MYTIIRGIWFHFPDEKKYRLDIFKKDLHIGYSWRTGRFPYLNEVVEIVEMSEDKKEVWLEVKK